MRGPGPVRAWWLRRIAKAFRGAIFWGLAVAALPITLEGDISVSRDFPLAAEVSATAPLRLAQANIDQPEEQPALQVKSELILRSTQREFGGLSGLEIVDAGRGFIAVSDKGTIWRGVLFRDDQGHLERHGELEMRRILTSKGVPVDEYNVDAEGLDRDSEGRFYISFESNSRVSRFDEWDAPATLIPNAEDFAGFGYNSGPEAVTIGPDDQPLLVPERSGKLSRPFPIYRWNGHDWDRELKIPRRGSYLVVGIEYDREANQLYVLERALSGWLQFSTRIRRFDIDEKALTAEQSLWQTDYGEYGNFEGISLWRDEAGRKFLSLISDNNFLPLFSTRIIELALTDQP